MDLEKCLNLTLVKVYEPCRMLMETVCLAEQRMKIYRSKTETSEGPEDTGIVLEGVKVLTDLGNFPRA